MGRQAKILLLVCGPKRVRDSARSRSMYSLSRGEGLMTRHCVLALLFLAIAATSWAAESQSARARLVVLTDIEADPDDTQSLVRLLLYSNELDIEGIVATTSIHMRDEIHPDSIVAIIDRYAGVRANLLKHASGYPAG